MSSHAEIGHDSQKISSSRPILDLELKAPEIRSSGSINDLKTQRVYQLAGPAHRRIMDQLFSCAVDRFLLSLAITILRFSLRNERPIGVSSLD